MKFLVLILAEIRRRHCRLPTQNNIVGTRQCLGLYPDGAVSIQSPDRTYGKLNTSRFTIKATQIKACSRSPKTPCPIPNSPMI